MTDVRPRDDPASASGSAATVRRRWPLVVGGVAIALAAVVVASIVLGAIDAGRPIPDFPSLVDHPDPTLHGTVAYTSAGGCVRIISASGSRSKDVYCLPPEDMSKAPEVGKEVGPQLVWLPDGRLEVTMFRMDPAFKGSGSDKDAGPPIVRGWQKVVDVRTGEVEDVPTADVPSELNLDTRPTVSADGRRLTTTSDGGSGKVEVVLTEGSKERTLLSAKGPGKYGYNLGDAFWAPSGAWAAADDTRILVITTDDPSTTRVLVEAHGRGGRSGGAEGATFAVSADDILTS
jgi:hypothetical protein